MSAKITAALHDVMSKVGYVQKTGKNTFHGYKYAGEADLLAVLRPAMVDAGLLLIPSLADHSPIDEHGNKDVVIEYTLAHKDGDVWPHKIRAIGTGNDRAKSGSVGDKGTYKALTGANKYLLFKLFQIETGDDPDKDGDEEREGGRPPANGNKPTPKPDPPKSERDREIDELRAYAQRVKDALLEAPDLHTVETIWREEFNALAELKTKSAKAHSHLVEIAQKRGFKEAA